MATTGKIDYTKLVTKEMKQEQQLNTLSSTFEFNIQSLLDTTAKKYGYDAISTAVSYADEPSVEKFQNDGKAFRQWRSLVWEYAYKELAKVKAGTRTIPTIEEFLQELPKLSLESAVINRTSASSSDTEEEASTVAETENVSPDEEKGA